MPRKKKVREIYRPGAEQGYQGKVVLALTIAFLGLMITILESQFTGHAVSDNNATGITPAPFLTLIGLVFVLVTAVSLHRYFTQRT